LTVFQCPRSHETNTGETDYITDAGIQFTGSAETAERYTINKNKNKQCAHSMRF
jgi:hypothetical protein